MRTTEQVHFRWALNGLGGVVKIVENLAEDGVAPDDETLSQLNDYATRLGQLTSRLIGSHASPELKQALAPPARDNSADNG